MIKGWKKRDREDIILSLSYRVGMSRKGWNRLVFPSEFMDKLYLLWQRGIIEHPDDSKWRNARYKHLFFDLKTFDPQIEKVIMMMQQTFTPFEVAQFISDEITSGASLAKKAMMKNIKNAGSVSKNRLQYLADGVIRDMILVNGVRQASEFPVSSEEVQILTEVIPAGEPKNLILDEPSEDKPKVGRKRRTSSSKKTVINEETVHQ